MGSFFSKGTRRSGEPRFVGEMEPETAASMLGIHRMTRSRFGEPFYLSNEDLTTINPIADRAQLAPPMDYQYVNRRENDVIYYSDASSDKREHANIPLTEGLKFPFSSENAFSINIPDRTDKAKKENPSTITLIRSHNERDFPGFENFTFLSYVYHLRPSNISFDNSVMVTIPFRHSGNDFQNIKILYHEDKELETQYGWRIVEKDSKLPSAPGYSFMDIDDSPKCLLFMRHLGSVVIAEERKDKVDEFIDESVEGTVFIVFLDAFYDSDLKTVKVEAGVQPIAYEQKEHLAENSVDFCHNGNGATFSLQLSKGFKMLGIPSAQRDITYKRIKCMAKYAHLPYVEWNAQNTEPQNEMIEIDCIISQEGGDRIHLTEAILLSKLPSKWSSKRMIKQPNMNQEYIYQQQAGNFNRTYAYGGGNNAPEARYGPSIHVYNNPSVDYSKVYTENEEGKLPLDIKRELEKCIEGLTQQKRNILLGDIDLFNQMAEINACPRGYKGRVILQMYIQKETHDWLRLANGLKKVGAQGPADALKAWAEPKYATILETMNG